MTATTRALELRPSVRAALDAAEVVLRAAPLFDPATAERTFTIAMADQSSFVVLPRLAERLGRDAPGIRLDVRAAPLDAVADELDLAVGVFLDTPANVHDEALWH